MMEDQVIPDAAAEFPAAGLDGLGQRVLARWRQLAAPPSSVVIVGFSGGPDSLALAAVLGRIAPLGGPRPILVHVDHGWRPGSAAEQERASAMAAKLGLPFQRTHLAVDASKQHPGFGLEEAARRERYRILAGAARAAGTDLVALAHHQDDQAETVLLHLLRGSGTAGAAGMRETRRVAVPWWTPATESVAEMLLWRPLLVEPRATVRAFAAETGLAAIDDPSNDDPNYRRNAIRQQALPVLERIVPGAGAALARFAALAAEDEAALAAIAATVLPSAVSDQGELRGSVVAAQPLAVRRRLARGWVAAAGGLSIVTAERTDAMLAMLESGEPGRRLELGDGVTVHRTRVGLYLGEADSAS